MSDVILVGRLAELADEIVRIVGDRTGYEIDIINSEIVTRYEAASEEAREEIIALLCHQAHQSADEFFGSSSLE